MEESPITHSFRPVDNETVNLDNSSNNNSICGTVQKNGNKSGSGEGSNGNMSGSGGGDDGNDGITGGGHDGNEDGTGDGCSEMRMVPDVDWIYQK